MTTTPLLKNRDLVCVALPTWEGDYGKAIVHLMSELALHNRVLYVDYAHTWKDIASTLVGRQYAPVKRMLGIDQRLRTLIAANGAIVHVLTPPPVFPINWIRNESLYAILLQLNAGPVGRSIRSAMKQLGFSNSIVVNAFNPFLGVPLARSLGEALLVYYCYDEIGAARWAKNHGQRLEVTMMQKSDGVVATSTALSVARSAVQPKTFLVKNGVDFDHFNRAWDPERRAGKERHVVGYVGSIDDRLDYDLLAQVIRHLPSITFRFVGRVTHPDFARRLAQFPNVELFGARPVSTLPLLLKDIDLGIIPFVRNEFTRGIYPLKINEYLAAGKPVVMTRFADLQDFESIASIVSTPDEFAAAVRSELETDSVSKGRVRIETARGNSWQHRANEFSAVILQLLGNPSDIQTPSR